MCACLSVNMLDTLLPIPDAACPAFTLSVSKPVARVMRHSYHASSASCVCLCLCVCVCEYAGRPSTYPRRSVTRRVSCVTRTKCHPLVCVCLSVSVTRGVACVTRIKCHPWAAGTGSCVCQPYHASDTRHTIVWHDTRHTHKDALCEVADGWILVRIICQRAAGVLPI